ncbi:MAG: hypothetical protein PUC43_06085, partial [Ellagibacter isourolithinifaciens]|nr:hypothetical protein [Ellagibacter isourolithinifaciens]
QQPVVRGDHLFCKRLGDARDVRVQYDGSIIQDVAAEKAQDMAEVGVTMNAREYRTKWYGKEERTAKARAQVLGKKGTAAEVWAN